MASRGGDPPAANAARRAWLARLDAATQRLLDDLRGSDDPALQSILPEAEQLSVRLQRELQRSDRDQEDAPGVR